MRILVACEFSGIVRDAFAARGHDAWSCDMLPTERPGNHIQGDVLGILGDGWDLMVAHPPCTYLSYVGMRHWNREGRKEKRESGMQFFRQLCDAPIERIAVENPLGFPCQVYRSPDQMIHPYYFGEPRQKRICLWLKNLRPLEYRMEDELFGKATATDKPEPMYVCQGEKCKGRKIHWTEGIRGLNGEHRSHARSRFFVSVANAMAAQWG